MWYEHTQEEIAEALSISIGSINKIIQEYVKSEGLARMVRDMLFSAKKNGIDLNQVISNLRYENALKRLGSDRDRFDPLLKGLEHLMDQNELDPQIAAHLVYEIVEIGLREQKSLHQIAGDLRLKQEASRATDEKLQINSTLLEDSNNSVHEQLKANNVTIAELTEFIEIRKQLGSYGIKDNDQVINILINIKEQGDPKSILEVMAKYISVDQELQQMEEKKEIQEQQCEELGKLADIERESSIRQESAAT